MLGQPAMEFIQNRFGLFLPYSLPVVRAQLGDFPLDLVELLDTGYLPPDSETS